MFFCAMIFGSIYCTAWEFPFSSLAKRTMWRVFSSIIVCLPAVLLFFSSLRLHLIYPFSIFNFIAIVAFIHLMDRADAVLVLNVVGLILYIPSRLVIILFATLSLRSPGENAFEGIDWTRFILHF